MFSELAASLNLPIDQIFHTGIKRDPSNNQIWRRVSDGEVAELDGWYPGDPHSDDGWDYLYWYFINVSFKNTIFNMYDQRGYFICEF